MNHPTAHDVFSATLHKSELWVGEVMRELGSADAQQAYAALRATLHVLRDRLSVEEAAQLAAQLPMLIRGLYYEGWRPRARAERIRHMDEFESLVRDEAGRPFSAPMCEVIRAVFRVLARHVSAGEIADVIGALPRDLQNQWPPRCAG